METINEIAGILFMVLLVYIMYKFLSWRLSEVQEISPDLELTEDEMEELLEVPRLQKETSIHQTYKQ